MGLSIPTGDNGNAGGGWDNTDTQSVHSQRSQPPAVRPARQSAPPSQSQSINYGYGGGRDASDVGVYIPDAVVSRGPWDKPFVCPQSDNGWAGFAARRRGGAAGGAVRGEYGGTRERQPQPQSQQQQQVAGMPSLPNNHLVDGELNQLKLFLTVPMTEDGALIPLLSSLLLLLLLCLFLLQLQLKHKLKPRKMIMPVAGVHPSRHRGHLRPKPRLSMMPVDGVLNLLLHLSRPTKFSQMTTQGDGIRSPLAVGLVMPVDGVTPLNPNPNPTLTAADGVAIPNPNLSLSPRTAVDGETSPLRRVGTTGVAEVAGELPTSLVRVDLEVVCRVNTVVVGGACSCSCCRVKRG